jgi:O-6-methylguanine DNA methyltransferase
MNMTAAVWFEPLRLADASHLRQSEIHIKDAQSVAAFREEIRQLLDLCHHQAWQAGLTGDLNTVRSAMGIQIIDSTARRAVLHLFTDRQGLLPDLLQAFIHKAFWELGLYRLEITVPADAQTWLSVIRQAGFSEEGNLRRSLFNSQTNRHQDVLMFSILRPECFEYGTAFIPFRLGVFAVTGHRQALTQASFIRFGEAVESGYQQECAEIAGLLDSNGCLADRRFFEDYLQSQSSIVQASAPQPVIQAASQIQAYFAGQLPQFDLPLDLSRGSAFQVKIWQELATIPYGSTWTYEELACRLTGGDWQAARRMARAVGSACGANPLPLILPCHRVIGKDGRLVGFSGGLDIKEFLLDHEIMGLNN